MRVRNLLVSLNLTLSFYLGFGCRIFSGSMFCYKCSLFFTFSEFSQSHGEVEKFDELPRGSFIQALCFALDLKNLS